MLCLFYLQKRRENIGKDVGAYLKYAEKRKETDIFMTALYETWTFQQEVPGLIQDLLNRLQKQKTSTKASDCSQYNTCRAKSATLHAPTLRAILWLAELYEGLETEGAVGRQFGENNETNYYCMEYKNKDVSYALIYNWKNGRFKGCVQKGDTVLRLSSIQKDKHVMELYIALLAFASTCYGTELYNAEFSQHFDSILKMLSLDLEMDEETLLTNAYICCDNLYRRVESGLSLKNGGIPIAEPQFTKCEFVESFRLKSGLYSPNHVEAGTFLILTRKKEFKESTIGELKAFYHQGKEIDEKYQNLIPNLPDSYKVNPDTQEILSMIVNTPSRLFMMEGDSGSGKTTDTKIIAQLLGYPRFVFTCGPGTEEISLMVSLVPNVDSTAKITESELPTYEDFKIDPASALAALTGNYQGEIDEAKAFQELLNAAIQQGYQQAKQEKDFVKTESTIIQACRMPAVIEIQEVAMIEKPGTLTRLNALFDDDAKTDLLNGEIIERHPDTVVIMTTNMDYIGCQMFNESVLSRMQLVQHRKELSVEEMTERAVMKTGCKEKDLIYRMATAIRKIKQYLRDKQIRGGVCGYRELENWVWNYMTSQDVLESATSAVISKVSPFSEERDIILRTFIKPIFEDAA